MRRSSLAIGPAPGAPSGGAAVVAVGVLLVLSLLLLAPADARAATSTAAIARALQRSPLFVDPAYADSFAPAARARFAREARTTPGHPRIAIARLAPGDQYGGDPLGFLAAIRSRLPTDDRDGVFVVSDDRYLRVVEYRDGRREFEGAADDAEYMANYVDGPEGDAFGRNYVDRVRVFLRQLRRPAAELRAAVAAAEKAQAARVKRSRNPSAPSGGGSRARDGGTPGWIVPVIVLLVVGVGVAIGVLVVRRSRRGAHPAHGPLPVVPDRVFEHALAAQRADLAEDAEQELLALAALLDEAPVPAKTAAQDAYQRALDAYTSARRRMTPDAPIVDLVGVLVLVDQARDHLARAAALDAGRTPARPVPLCVFHPLHGRSAKRVAWRDGLQVPACTACAAAVRAGRAPDALRDGDRPYFEGDTVWARTGYGAFDDDLVGRVARGER